MRATGDLALLPQLLAALDGPDVVVIGEDDTWVDEATLDRIGFFVPTYMGQAANLELMQAMPRLQVCQLLTAGYEHARQFLPSGVTLCNAAGVHDASTAELAVGLIIARLRGLDDAARDMARGHWGHRSRPALADRTVLVIGAGGVGRAIAGRLEPFECDVTVLGRTARSGVRAAIELPALLPLADVVVLAVPLDSTTVGMVDGRFLSQMQDGSLLVNVARGGVVDTDALLAECASGRLMAALDVTDPEPLPPDHPLWTCPGVFISPHVGGNTTAFLPRAERLVREQLDRWRSGSPLANVVVGISPSRA